MTNKIKLSLVASLLVTSAYAVENKDLGMITVSSATKSEQSIKDITSNVEVITGAELEEKHITSVTEALNLISGIGFSANGGLGATTSLYLRGMNTSRTLVLIDGVRYQDPSNSDGANIAHIMISDIDKIEVIKGTQSGIWGADAAAGVINIITKEPKNGISGNIIAEAGSFNTKKYGALVSHKNKKYDIKLNANKITTDGFTTKLNKGDDIDDFEDDGYKNTTLNLKSNIYINDSSKVNLNLSSIDALKEYDTNSADDTTMKSDVETKQYNLAYTKSYKNHNIKAVFEKSDFKREEIGTQPIVWGMFTFEAVTDFNGEYNNIELNDNIKYNKNDFLIIGAGNKSEEVDFVRTNDTVGDKETKNSYAYVTNSNLINDLIVTESLRYDKFNNFENQTTGKIGLKYNISKDSYLSSNYGTAYNVPNLITMLNPWGAPRLDLKPEKIKSFDISFKYKSLLLTYFNQNIEDMIVFGTQYSNEDATIKGIEFDYKQSINNILFNLNYTKLDTEDKDGKKLARRADQTLKFGIDYYGIKKLHIGINGEYVGERFDEADKEGEQTGKYTIANFVANYELNKKFKIYVKIDNLTDKEYQTVDGYATSPRAYYAGVKVSF